MNKNHYQSVCDNDHKINKDDIVTCDTATIDIYSILTAELKHEYFTLYILWPALFRFGNFIFYLYLLRQLQYPLINSEDYLRMDHMNHAELIWLQWNKTTISKFVIGWPDTCSIHRVNH